TWNRELFPEPRKFFENIHGKGARACMNLHPADGVHPHEEAYPAMARHMGMDPDEKKPVEFDISDPQFIDGYFRYLHHPLEKDGVDFWWIDWQQGTKSKVAGLDPLFYLNHLHALDRARDGRKRPFIFSRWSGRGAHRTPIGFSGDTYATWKTLRFLPWFTATAANVGFGWWSHDTAGFARGIQDQEMYVRWNQFTCWSPIYRIHSTCDAKADNRPWMKEAEYRDAAMNAMRTRKKMEPYIYTAAWQHHREGMPLVRPMYFEHAEKDAAYLCPEQYMFGPDLLVAPLLEDRKVSTRLSRSVAWLPEGGWLEFDTGLAVNGGRWKACYGDLDEVPVFAKAGSVLPTAKAFNEAGEVAKMEWLAFAGNDGAGECYFDDGISMDYGSGHYALVECRQAWSGDRVDFTWKRKDGEYQPRDIHSLRLRGLNKVDFKSVIFDDREVKAQWDGNDLMVRGIKASEGRLEIAFEKKPAPLTETKHEILHRLIWHMPINTHSAQRMFEKLEQLAEKPELLAMFMADLDFDQMRTLVESTTGACFQHFPLHDGRDAFCYSSPEPGMLDGKVVLRKDMHYDLVDVGEKPNGEWVFDARNAWYDWKVQVRYLGFLNFEQQKPLTDAIREDT
ncbi:MAG: TIM-barrel domain-containing protein, partial [Candidatus Sumerlaeota bacterium]